MKTIILPFLIFFNLLNLFGQEQSKLSKDSLYHTSNGEVIHTRVHIDSIPKYQPNHFELFSYITKNLNYPSDARENGIEGKVFSSFIVEKDGTISDVIIIKGLTESCNNEVIRVLSTLPNKFTPAVKNGQPVRFQYIFPVSFKIDGVKTKKKK